VDELRGLTKQRKAENEPQSSRKISLISPLSPSLPHHAFHIYLLLGGGLTLLLLGLKLGLFLLTLLLGGDRLRLGLLDLE